MRIGAISDIHSNAAALDAALTALAGEVDQIWCAGDIVVQYRFCNETVARLRGAEAIAIQGNHDMVLVSAGGADARRRSGVDDDAVQWLAALPLRHEADFDGCRVLMVHGSPWPPHGDYLRAGNDRWQRADELGADILITGHTHEPMVATFGTTLVVNPGSVGEPRQRDEPGATYAVIDTVTREARIAWL